MMDLDGDTVADCAAGPRLQENFSLFSLDRPRDLANGSLQNMAVLSTEQRLHTYKQWKDCRNSLQLAMAGFVYTGRVQEVNCNLCGIILQNASTISDPFTLHRQMSPSCQFFSSSSLGTGNSYHTDRSLLRHTYPENSLRYEIKYKDFQELEARERSFNGWPLLVQQPPRYLSKCGFFYIGSADRVRCFSCGITIRNWDAEDDPYVEHKRWSPKCQFIKLLDPSKLIPCASDPFSTDFSNDLESTESVISSETLRNTDVVSDGKQITESMINQGEIKNEQTSIGHEVQELMNSPKVLAVIEMGFPRNAVETVVLQRKRISGDEYPDAVSLFEAVEEFMR